MKKLLSFLLLVPGLSLALLDYERAIIQTQKNNWPAAQELLTNVIVENPERPDALYDLGVASYKNNNFDTALSYFNKAASHSHANLPLQQQAHFNAGNTHVQLKQLPEAIDAYDRVLAQQPDHKQALHNKEVVKKMLEQQKQEQQDKDQNKDEQKEDSSDTKDKDDRQNKKDQDKQSEDNKQDQQEKQNQQDKNKDQQGNQEQNKKDKKSGNEPDQKNKPDQSNADKSGEKKDEPGSKQTEKSVNKENQQKSAGVNETKQQNAGEQKKDSQNPAQQLSAGLARALEDREKKDAQLNKKMTKALVANQGGSKNDYNCW